MTDEKDARIAELEESLEEYALLVSRQSRLLTDTVNVLKGMPPELTTWSHHDVAELARQLLRDKQRSDDIRMNLSYIILFGAAQQGCNWASDGTPAAHHRIYNETVRLAQEKSWQEGYDQGVHDGIDSYETGSDAARMNPYRWPQ